jgi:hypothetical protein
MLFQLNRAQPGVAQAARALLRIFAAGRAGSPTRAITLPDIHKMRRLIDLRVFAEMLAG